MRQDLFKRLFAGLLLAVVMGAGPVLAADKAPPPTKKTAVIRSEIYKVLEEAQQASEAGDARGAMRLLDKLKADSEDLNPYERATMWNFYAAMFYALDDNQNTIRAYKNVLKEPDIPEGLRNTTMFALAQLYFIIEDYRQSIKALQDFFRLVPDVKPEAYMLQAQAHYQLEEYKQAEGPILQALGEAKKRDQQPKENWLGLLRAVYYELGNYPKAAKVLEIMVKMYPKEAYYLQLAGMYGLMGEQKKQLAVTHAAFKGGLLSREADIVNLARLYMAEEAPYPAVKVMQQALNDKRVESDVNNLQLLAQAMSLAQDFEGQVPVLRQTAQLSGESKHYLYLGQALIALERWDDAIESFEKALKIGGLERPGSAHMQIGTAHYYLNKYSSARKAFVQAAKYDRTERQASNWIKFMDSEIAREKALAAY